MTSLHKTKQCSKFNTMSLDNELKPFEDYFKKFPHSYRLANWLNETYYILNSQLGILFRKQNMRPGQAHTDCIPNFWLYCFKRFNGEISFLRNGKIQTLWGPQALFIPPFSIVNWHFNVEQINWYAYEGTSPLTLGLPQEPIYFSAEENIFYNQNEIFDYVNANNNQWKLFGAQNKTSAVAIKTKNYIDLHFSKDFKISELAQVLNYSIDVMTRQFKKMYGITPSTYLRDLKFYQAALKITESNDSLRGIANNVGIENYENFSKVFRKIFKTSPKNFRE